MATSLILPTSEPPSDWQESLVATTRNCWWHPFITFKMVQAREQTLCQGLGSQSNLIGVSRHPIEQHLVVMIVRCIVLLVDKAYFNLFLDIPKNFKIKRKNKRKSKTEDCRFSLIKFQVYASKLFDKFNNFFRNQSKAHGNNAHTPFNEKQNKTNENEERGWESIHHKL